MRFALVLPLAVCITALVANAFAANVANPVGSGSLVPDKIKDAYIPVEMPSIQVGGILGDRMKVNTEDRLLNVDEHALVDGFVHRPGSHPWIGEHAGKFLHAAANAWLYSQDPRLKTLMDRIANTLIDSQMPDGYLGTYSKDKRWTSWDVWSHKYDLIGLLSWYDVTHDQRALTACKKIGDLLCATFGDDAPGKLDLSDSGTQDGMAPTSVLEPMCYLYRHTGDKKYLDFCYYITRNIEKHSKIISSLTEGKRVDQTSNAKAYEMLSNLVGLVELYRITGDKKFLVPAVNAWESIARNHLYISGTTSAFEHFRAPDKLPGGAPDNVGEGCVTVTWEQLNLSLLRLTADPRYADQLERTIYNALIAAQNPENGDICYFTPLVGTKPYTHEVCCCLSSEPRGIALIPQAIAGVVKGAIVLNLYAPGTATFTLDASDGRPLTVKMTSDTDFPRTGKVKLTFEPSREVRFDVQLRQPSWSDKSPNTYQRVTIDPTKSKTLELNFDMTPRLVPGGASYPTFIAVERGPQVLALDPSANPQLPIPTLATVTDPGSIKIVGDGFDFAGLCSVPDRAHQRIDIKPAHLKLVTFADSTRPIVWMPTRDHLMSGPLPITFEGKQSQSRPRQTPPWMPHQGAFTDLRPDTYRTTYNRRSADQDWYAIELKQPAPLRRVVFTQGPTNPDGGWFDASAGKPQIQVKTPDDPQWQTVATLESYPATTATDPRGLEAGQSFQAKLDKPVQITALRILGKPADGNNPKNACSSCAELAGYAD
jgi:DUF1680 family protein